MPGRETSPRLPPLREELKLIAPGAATEGSPRWLIYDPARHSYFEIGRATFEVLSLWREQLTRKDLVLSVQARFGRSISEHEVDALSSFLSSHFLIGNPVGGDWRQLAAAARRNRSGALQWLLHHYLFFKVPLLQPQGFLVATLPFARVFYRKGVIWLIALLGLVGLYLVSREWEAFLTTFQSFFSLEGAAAFAVALVFIKALHELGHAYTVVRYGGHVPAIGVAFMLMTPMLYTDVTDAWRLKSRRHRLLVGSAGVIVELLIACLATFLWAFMPDGPFKGVLFVTATSSWMMSLAINLNPFMRFDGYFILSDLTGIPNLQPRSFALARWHLRETLFGLGAPPPEEFERGRRLWLIAYAWATWIYRLVLFIGIAVVVYLYFFKLLGVALFVFEIAFFVVKPIWSEIMEWRKRAAEIASRRRTYVTVGGAALLAAVVLVPWSARVDIPVVIEPAAFQRVFAPLPAAIGEVSVVAGQRVAKGDVLAVMKSDLLEQQIAVARQKINAVRVRLSRLAADAKDRKAALVLERELSAALASLDGLLRQQTELTLRAPLDGEVVEVAQWLHPGRFVGTKEALATVAQRSPLQARGYIGEKDVWRVAGGAPARFIADDASRASIPLSVREIGRSGVAAIDIEDLASMNGGAVEVVPQQDGRLAPVLAQYHVVLDAQAPVDGPEARIRGIAVIEGLRQSFADRLWHRVVRVLVREGGI